LSHRAESRAIFARGALVAARFLVGKPAGLYTMRDVVDAQGNGV
jgi:4-hydroxy-tetrahydrodipicolinate reductase